MLTCGRAQKTGLNQELKHRYGPEGRTIQTSTVHPMWTRTRLVGSWESSLAAQKQALLDPAFVADRIVKRVLSGSGGQEILPATMSKFTALRGWPNWLQEVLRDLVGEATRPV